MKNLLILLSSVLIAGGALVPVSFDLSELEDGLRESVLTVDGVALTVRQLPKLVIDERGLRTHGKQQTRRVEFEFNKPVVLEYFTVTDRTPTVTSGDAYVMGKTGGSKFRQGDPEIGENAFNERVRLAANESFGVVSVGPYGAIYWGVLSVSVYPESARIAAVVGVLCLGLAFMRGRKSKQRKEKYE